MGAQGIVGVQGVMGSGVKESDFCCWKQWVLWYALMITALTLFIDLAAVKGLCFLHYQIHNCYG